MCGMARASMPRLAVAVHPRPQLLRIERVESAERHLRRRAAAEDHVAVQVLVLGAAGELVADEGREAARLVVALGRRDGLLPGGAHDVQVEQALAIAEGVRPDGGVGCRPLRAPQRTGRDVLRERRVGMARDLLPGIQHRRQHAEEAGVVGDRVEVQRRVEPDLESGRVGQGLSLRVAVGVVGGGPGAVEERVVREAGVRVEVAEIGGAQRVRAFHCAAGGYVTAGRRPVRQAVAVTGAARQRKPEQRGGTQRRGGSRPADAVLRGAMVAIRHAASRRVQGVIQIGDDQARS